ncbi:DUF3099 domain-containing protein [Microbacterium schleiferi]|uniref:DUF3099 domain-containing protein n=1 Tax=Microbacterium schleiferi TaxID=69362 RepID=A0A7S8MYU8_9MICO|nr:DUF3099 domain-containing protein [Microbacterium schleiferi]QPE05754.1 DUF3099 domain-containing protein [Microbacterium schleiferi]
MKPPTKPQPATSLPRAPKEDAGKRSTTYLIMMGIRLVCFALVLFVTPYSWYTWVFAAMAIFLPYLAVVIANVSADMTAPTALGPERMIEAPAPSPAPTATAAPAPQVIRIDESPQEPAGDS